MTVTYICSCFQDDVTLDAGAFSMNFDFINSFSERIDEGTMGWRTLCDYFSRESRNRVNLHIYRHPYLIFCYLFGCFRIAYGSIQNFELDISKSASTLLSFGNEKLLSVLEIRRLELGNTHLDVLRLLAETNSGDLEASLSLQRSALGSNHIVCLETEIEIARRRKESLLLEKKLWGWICCVFSTYDLDNAIAEVLCTEARLFKIQRQELGLLHPNTIKTVLSLSLSLQSQHGGQWAIQKLERSLGPHHVLCTEAREQFYSNYSGSGLRKIFMAGFFFFALPVLFSYLFYVFYDPDGFFVWLLLSIAIIFAIASVIRSVVLFAGYRQLWRAVSDPQTLARPAIQEALEAIRTLDETVVPFHI